MAWVNDEMPAAEEVQRLLDRAEAGRVRILFSLMNAGAVFYLLAKRCGPEIAMQFNHRLSSLPLTLVAPGTGDIWRAADLKGKYGMSYADAFAAALALDRGIELLTGGADFRPVENSQIH